MNENAEKGNAEKEQIIKKLTSNSILLRVRVGKDAKCTFSYSDDGKTFTPIKGSFTAQPGKWIGAKVGIFALQEEKINDSGYADFDWFRFTKN